MSHRILRYEEDGEERWAVWSTVVEDWIVYDMTTRQLREWYYGKEMEKARKHIKTRIKSLRNGVNPYTAWNPDEKREELP